MEEEKMGGVRLREFGWKGGEVVGGRIDRTRGQGFRPHRTGFWREYIGEGGVFGLLIFFFSRIAGSGKA